ncbi:MAG TPA: FecR domain-containing protein [Pseudolabrys sp.]|nr:FecR domain-containing protein [Pseudolabrys sp.]
MKRREFFPFLVGVVSWSFAARAQTQPGASQAVDDAVGQIATLQGGATVTRGKTAAAALKISDAVYRNDVLATGTNAALGVTFDDETTLSLSANARIVVDDFVYEKGTKGNKAVLNVARGTVAFVASLVAKTGDMTITTPTSTLGIRGTTGVVDVPDNAAAGGAGEAKIKLYPDADGRVGRIEVFSRQGERLGALTQGSSAFAIRPGVGGRFAAVPFQIPPQEAARDRDVVQRLFASHNIGRQMILQRRQLRGPNLPRQNQRPNQRPNLQQQNPPGRSGVPQSPNPNLQQKGNPAAPKRGGGLGGRLKKLNPFAPKRNDQLPR